MATVKFVSPYAVYFAPAPTYIGGLSENQVVRDKTSGAIYKLSGGYKLHYPNMGTYSAHGTPTYTDVDPWFLVSIPQGANIYPIGVSEGQVIRDPTNGAIYKLVNGKKSHYSSMEAYSAHGSPAFTNVDSATCANIVDGPAMNPYGIVDGAVVRDKSSGAIYRIMNGHKHHYPNMPVYTAHGSPAFVDHDSSHLTSIPDGPSILAPGFYEGQVIRNKSSGAIYRIVQGKKSHYPNMQVYGAQGSPAFVDFDATAVANIPDGPSY